MEKIYQNMWNFALKGLLFLVSVTAIYYGIMLFHKGSNMIASCLFFSGVVALIVFFCFGKKITELPEHLAAQGEVIYPPVKYLLLKVSVVVILVLLGQFFLVKNMDVPGVISYTFAFVQLVLLFKTRAPADIGAAMKGPEPYDTVKNWKKVTVKAFIYLVMIVFYYIAFVLGEKDSFAGFLFVFILASLILSGLKLEKTEEQVAKFDLVDAAIIIILTAVAIFVRLYRLVDIPPGIVPIELRLAAVAGGVNSGGKLPVFLSDSGWQFPSLIFQLYALCFKFYHVSTDGAKFITAIIGAMNTTFIYLLARTIFTRRVALISAVLVAFMGVHMLFSRQLEFMVANPAIATACFYFYFLGVTKNRPVFFVLSGIMLGLNLYFYNAAKIVPFIFLAFWAVSLLKKEARQSMIKNSGMLIVFVAASIVVFTPLLDFIIKSPDQYFKRMSGMALLPALPKNPSAVNALADQFMLHFRMFFSESCAWGVFNLAGKPAFDPITVFFFVIGMSQLFLNLRRNSYFYVFLWLFFGMLVGFLTIPVDLYQGRVTLALPAVALIAAIGLDTALKFFDQYIHYFRQIVSNVILAVLLAVAVGMNLYAFFVLFPQDPSTKMAYFYQYQQMRKVIEQNPDTKVMISKVYMGERTMSLLPATLLNVQRKYNDVDLGLLELSAFYNNEGKDVLVIGEGVYRKFFDIYKEYFPGCITGKKFNADTWLYSGAPGYKNLYGWHNPDNVMKWLREKAGVGEVSAAQFRYISFMYARVPYADIKELFSIDLKSGGAKERIYDTQFAAKNRTGVEITSLVEIPDYGKYQFAVEGTGSYSVAVDGDATYAGKKLYKGLHRIKINISGEKAPVLRILWKKENGASEQVPVKYFINSDKIFGLMARYNRNNSRVYEELEPMMAYNTYGVIPRPYIPACGDDCIARKTGYINIDTDGYYSFYLMTFRNTKVDIAGGVVAEGIGEEKSAKPERFYKKGTYPITIEMDAKNWESPVVLMYRKKGSALYAEVPHTWLRSAK